MADFVAHAHPVLAVPCPDCRARTGAWCVRPSGHRAADFHAARKRAADREFIAQHGETAAIHRTPDGGWRITDETGAAQADSEQLPLFAETTGERE